MSRAQRRSGRVARTCAVLAASAGLAVLQSPAVSAAPAEGQPLKDVTTRYVGSAVAADALANEADYRSVLTREFDSVTPENAMKWAVVEPRPDQHDWSGADAVVNHAQRTGKSVRGHTLVWHRQAPSWLADLSPSQLRSALKEHITTTVNRYEGSIRAWDVVNEVFNEDGTRRNSIFQRKLGKGWIADAFRWAHRADPSAKLYINDFNIEGRNAKSDALHELVRSLKQRDVPIHGVGFQSHLSIEYAFPSGFQQNLRRFAGLGVDVAITEIDVRMPTPATERELDTQAEYFKRAWDACHAVSRCVEFTTWGFTDRHSWVPEEFAGQGAACLFDRSLNPKPAYYRINPTVRP